MELAAETVDHSPDTFTGRPMSASRTHATWDEIRAFARFAHFHLLAWPHFQDERIVLVPILMGGEWLYLYGPRVPGYEDQTWISFDREGHVTVSIPRRDYLNYKEDLTFDQLCVSLGQLFVEFLDLHRRGDGVRILDRMDALQIAPVS